ncbi:MAG: M1 family aminopeptidase [Bacteroidota bacterium]
MKKNFASIWLPLFAFFLIACPAAAQISDDHFIKLVETEKQSFPMKGDGNRGNSTNLTNTVASNNFDVTFYRCEWAIDPNIRFITGKVTSYFTVTSASDKIVFDLSDTLSVDSIIYHGNQLGFTKIGNDGLQLEFTVTLDAGKKDSVSIYYKGVPRANTGSKPFVQTTHDGVPVIWTLSEPYGAKEWWPCKNGLNDKADSLDIIIVSPSAYKGVANGVLKSESIQGGAKTVYFKHRYPIATYLLGIAVTNYITDIDSIQLGDKMMPVLLNAYPENENTFNYVTYVAKQCLPVFSKLFGEYPFIKEHYSQTQCGFGGGMEHQTNTFTGDSWNQTTAHELGHHWFGDNVTCGSWQDIWLNEGFANYTQFIFVQNFDTTLIMAHLHYYLDLITSLPGGSVFVTDTTSAARIFDNRLTYAKGGYVVHMLRGILGDSIFFRGLRQYLNDPIVKNKFATTIDLERNLEQVSGKNLKTFFQKWIYGEGYPNYNCTWTQNSNHWIKVQMNQTTSDPSVSFYDMPVQLQFKNSSRDTIITVNNQRTGETFWVNPGFTADTMIIDPNYWILAKYRIVKKIPAQSVLPNDIKIYPNPATDHVFVSLLNPISTKLSIRLFNTIGQLVYSMQKELNGQDELIFIPTSQFARGVYILKIYDNKAIKATKTIVI